MKYPVRNLTAAALAGAALIIASAPARAAHTYAGSIDTNADTIRDTLSFVNNNTGAAVTSLPTRTMLPATTGTYQNYYIPDTAGEITWTAIQKSNTVWNGSAYLAAKAWGASLGSYVELRIDSITGPAGGHFGFWDHGSLSPDFVGAVGLTGGTFVFELTDEHQLIGDGLNDMIGEPPTTLNGGPSPAPLDPYGHIHGRQFSVDLTGLYTVNYVLHDVNGLLADSAAFSVNYSAVPEPSAAWILGAVPGLAFMLRRQRVRHA